MFLKNKTQTKTFNMYVSMYIYTLHIYETPSLPLPFILLFLYRTMSLNIMNIVIKFLKLKQFNYEFFSFSPKEHLSSLGAGTWTVIIIAVFPGSRSDWFMESNLSMLVRKMMSDRINSIE